MFFDLAASYNGSDYINYNQYNSEGIADPFIQASIECVQLRDTSRLKEIVFCGLKKLSL